MDFDKVKDFAEQHDDQVDSGLDKAGDFAKDKVEGHDEQIDQGVQKAQDAFGKDS